MEPELQEIPGTSIRLASGREHVLRRIRFGGAASPAMAVVAGVHGNEYNGVAACHVLGRILRDLQLPVAGTIDLYPAVNPVALNLGQRWWPLSPVYSDMNRTFTSENEEVLGDPVTEVARHLRRELAAYDLVVDVHSSASYFREVPYVRAAVLAGDDGLLSGPLRLALRHANLPIALLRRTSKEPSRGLLSESLAAQGTLCLAMEGGTAGSVSRHFVSRVSRALVEMSMALGLIDDVSTSAIKELLLRCGTAELYADDLLLEPLLFQSQCQSWVLSPAAGLFFPEATVKPGSFVREGQVVGRVASVDLSSTDDVLSLADGYVLSLRKKLPVHEGGQLARVLPVSEQLQGLDGIA